MIIRYTGKDNCKPPAVLSGVGAVLGKPSIEDFLCIRVDTREQLPIDFDSAYCHVDRGTIPVGDYSLQGDELLWSIERKNLSDLIQSIILSQSWRRELAKINKMQARLLPVFYIVEATFQNFLEYDFSVFRSGRVTVQFACRRYAELSYNQNVHVVWAGNRSNASYIICLLLKRRLEETRMAK